MDAERALKALGYEYKGDDETGIDWVSDANGAFRQMPNGEELIGMLLVELDRLYKGEFTLNGSYGGLQKPVVQVRAGIPQDPGNTILEALTAAVEAAKEKPASLESIAEDMKSCHKDGDLEKFFGCAPGLTGGLTAREYIEKIRGEE